VANPGPEKCGTKTMMTVTIIDVEGGLPMKEEAADVKDSPPCPRKE